MNAFFRPGGDDDADDLEVFAAALGRLMAAGLNRLPDATQSQVAQAVSGGGQVFALVTMRPIVVRGMLQAAGGPVELFRAGEGPTWS
jgi:hypothetical protein